MLLLSAVFLSTCATVARTGSIVRDPCLHVGARPADLTMVDDYSDGTGLSLRVSTDWPLPCAATDGGRP